MSNTIDVRILDTDCRFEDYRETKGIIDPFRESQERIRKNR